MKKIFHFFSSIRLAIPLLLVLILATAIGTFLESTYGIEKAQIWVYRSNWFFLLFVLLFFNILFATLSRIPFRQHHIGFVITHLGILTILIGAFLTHQYGIDGTLSLQEGESGNEVLQRELTHQEIATPIETDHPSDLPAVGFLLKNQQFQIGELLYYPDRAEIDFGPLQVFLSNELKKTPRLFLYDEQSSKVLKEIDLLKEKKFEHSGFNFQVLRLLERAVVGEKGLQEGNQINPALELRVQKNGKIYKDILFAAHPEFHLNEGKYSGFRLRYDAGLGVMGQIKKGIGILALSREQALVQIFENQMMINSQELISGESLQTPWMGIEFTLGNVFPHAKISTQNSLQKTFISKKVSLPFKIKLKEFEQINYPGTQKAKEYKSRVIVNGQTEFEISMNNPLKFQGYTVYQSSFDLNTGEKPISIFSVSSDPGRIIKYIGSVILALGIIVYTLMRSRFFQRKKEGNDHATT